jgi:hypothetical protein
MIAAGHGESVRVRLECIVTFNCEVTTRAYDISIHGHTRELG